VHDPGGVGSKGSASPRFFGNQFFAVGCEDCRHTASFVLRR
jgi:hypothetical protein